MAQKAKKPIFVKETGFPHGGKPKYTLESQLEFWTSYLKKGILVRKGDSDLSWVFHGVAFEGFDLHWKAQESGMEIEKSWGFFSNKREPYSALSAWKSVRKKEVRSEK